VMRQGRLVECDRPRLLMERESVFREMHRAHHERR
jgi:ABC-type multidrug transport system fused ATPase/permease subunit